MFKVLLLLVSVAGHCAAQGNTTALEALVARQLPLHADSFVFYLSNQSSISAKSTDAELDTFTLFDGDDRKVHIECSTTSACSRGLYT
jgi:hypothetical protein